MMGTKRISLMIIIIISGIALFTLRAYPGKLHFGIITAIEERVDELEKKKKAKEKQDSSSDEELENPYTFESKGDRLLGMDILNSAKNGTFEGDFEKAREFGIEFTGLHLLWNQIETSPGNYTDDGDVLATFNSFCSANEIKLSLTIRPIDLTGKTVPADLESTRFNTELMKSRFKSLIDFVFTKIDYQLLTSLQIGNEIDGYDTSSEHPDFWSDYGDFLFNIRTYVDSQYPGLKVGYTVTLLGVINGEHSTSGVFEAISNVVHVVGVTYYPQNGDFTVMDPNVVNTHFGAITSKFAGKTIYLQEVGYQTGSECNSSERKQSQFIGNVFEAWDTYKDNIKLIEFVRMNDVSRSQAEELAGPYGIGDNSFIEFLRTLGLRTYDGNGTDKEGFTVLKEHANLRGWVNN